MASLSFSAVVIMITIAGHYADGDLRPSDHGLLFQNSPPAPANSSMEMKSFFNSSPTSTSSDVSLPKATNSTESLPPSWRRGSGGGRHWGGALMVASLVCGITGVILLLASALLYLFIVKNRRNPTPNESFRHNNSNDDANKLHLVPVGSIL